MQHDLETKLRYGREVSNKIMGCDKQGWMSYSPTLKVFSACSYLDLKSHYNEVMEKYGEWCLEPFPEACT